MGRVFVAGSINMDVVATADRHPEGRRDRRRPGRALFSGRQGRQPGGRCGEARRIDRADRPAGHRCLRPAIADVPRRARRRPRARQGHRRIPIPERPSSPSPMPTTPSWSFPAPTRWSVPTMSPPPVLAKGDVAVSQFEIPHAHDRRLLQTGARGRRDHHPQSGAGDRLRPGIARSRRHPDPQRDRARVSRKHRTSRYRRPCPLHRSGATPAGRVRTKSSASRWASAACSRWSTASPR